MGLFFRKSINLGGGTRLNLSGRGASLSKRLGPLSISSSGRGSLRLLKGLGFRFKL